MKIEKNYTFTPNKITAKIPVEIKNVKDKSKRESRENLHFVELAKHTQHHQLFPKINKPNQKLTSFRDILLKQAELKCNFRNEESTHVDSPKDLKKSTRSSSHFPKTNKIPKHEESTRLDANLSPEHIEKKLENIPSAKHFNISLVYAKQQGGHRRHRSEGVQEYESNSNLEKSENKGTKTTKDSSFSSLKVNSVGKSTNLQVESVEELHFLYNNLYKQNKQLAFKFENLELEEEDLLPGEEQTIYI